jgi:bromodomain-containing factor 1
MGSRKFLLPPKFKDCDPPCAVCTRIAPDGTPLEEPEPVFRTYKLVKVQKNFQAPLSAQEFDEFEEKQPKLAEWKAEFKDTMWYKACSKILKTLKKNKRDVGPFLVPVDPKLVPDYHKVIKHPMDLGTIEKKLEGGEYTHPNQFVGDVRLVFRNAYVYNKDVTIVWGMAERLSLTFEAEMWKLSGG